MDYSFQPKARYKEMKYFRYSLLKEELFEETIYCKNELGFLKFLDDMNSGTIYSKFFSRVNREIQRKGRSFIFSKYMVVVVKSKEDNKVLGKVAKASSNISEYLEKIRSRHGDILIEERIEPDYFLNQEEIE